MDIYRIAVAVGGRDLEVHAKAGILATVEVGTHQDRKTKPRHKVALIVGSEAPNPTWIQVSEFDSTGVAKITHEGWISNGSAGLNAVAGGQAITAGVLRVANPTGEIAKCQQEAKFGPLACCTAYGNGCYVTCCGGCCADPTGCPGASCCP